VATLLLPVAAVVLVHVALNVGDVIPGVPVQWLFEPLLIQIVADEANGPAQYKQAVEAAVGNELISLLLCEGAARAQHVYKAGSNAAIYIQDESLLFAGCDL
jgi:hypothetical protein